jgi:hypothetical protein
MKKLDPKIMDSAIHACGLDVKAGMLKDLHDKEVENKRVVEAFGWHNFDDIETLVGLEGNYLWAENPFSPGIIQFQFNPGQVCFQGNYTIFGKEEGVFYCAPNNPAIGYAFISLDPQGSEVIRTVIISGMMTDAEWKINIMLLNKIGNQGPIQPPFSAIRMV